MPCIKPRLRPASKFGKSHENENVHLTKTNSTISPFHHENIFERIYLEHYCSSTLPILFWCMIVIMALKMSFECFLVLNGNAREPEGHAGTGSNSGE